MGIFDADLFSVPTLNANAKSRAESKRSGTLQQTAASITPQQAVTAGPKVSQEIGAKATQAAGEEVVQEKASILEQAVQKTQISQQHQQIQQRSDSVRRRMSLERKNIQQRQQIARLGRDTERKLFDQRMEFQYDEMGIKFSNMRQIADFKRMTAKDDEDFANFTIKTKHRTEQKRRLLQIAHAKIVQEIEMGFRTRENEKNHAHYLKLAKAKYVLEQKMKRDAAEARNTMMIYQGVGMAAGAGLGFGTPAGAILGASAGQAVGSIVGGVTAKEAPERELEI